MRRKNWSVCHSPCGDVLSASLVGLLTSDQFENRSICNPLTYREVNDIVSETQKPIKSGL